MIAFIGVIRESAARTATHQARGGRFIIPILLRANRARNSSRSLSNRGETSFQAFITKSAISARLSRLSRAKTASSRARGEFFHSSESVVMIFRAA
jgi:hypothetical protein